MKDNRCFLCKYSGNQELGTFESVLFGKKGKSLAIRLCYTHGVELFKVGQTNFALKYSDNFKERYGVTEDDEIIDLFRKRAKGIFDF